MKATDMVYSCRGGNTIVGLAATDIARGSRACPECDQMVKFNYYNALRMTSKLVAHKRVKVQGEPPALSTRRRRPSPLAERIR